MSDLKIEYISIDELKPYKHNAKIHTDEQIKQIAKSIKEFGFNDPIAVDEENIIIEGHGRLFAAKELGMDKLPIIRLEGLTDQQKKAYILAHNQLTLNTGFDLDILKDELNRITDFNMEDFGLDIDFAEDIDPDDVVEVEVPNIPTFPKSKYGEIYQLGNHRLMCGNSININDVAKLMNGELADLLFTDPPYNNDDDLVSNTGKGIDKNNSMSDESFSEFLINAFNNAHDQLKEGGAYYVWSSSVIIAQFIDCLKAADLPMHQLLIWVKNSINMGHSDYKWKHEPCLYGWKPGASHYFINEYNNPTIIEEDQLDFSKMKKEEMQQLLEYIFSDKVKTTIIYEHRAKNDLHPTMKPLKMCADLIHNSSKQNELVLDLFGGSGSTMMACEQLNRKCYMMEYDPKYVDVIIERWETFTGQKAIKLN